MFTGIVQGIGFVTQVTHASEGNTISINYSCLKNKTLTIGDSVSVNGVCLTITEFENDDFLAHISETTLQHTNLGDLRTQSLVNLELALTLAQGINGHLVSGHVNGTSKIKEISKHGFSYKVKFSIPSGLSHLIVKEGSITLDGVSLTVNKTNLFSASVTIIPHTFNETIIKQWIKGSLINIEVDMLAKYLENLHIKK